MSFKDCSRIKGSLAPSLLEITSDETKNKPTNPYPQTRSGNLSSLPCPMVKKQEYF